MAGPRRASESGSSMTRRSSAGRLPRLALHSPQNVQKLLGITMVVLCMVFLFYASFNMQQLHQHSNARLVTFREALAAGAARKEQQKKEAKPLQAPRHKIELGFANKDYAKLPHVDDFSKPHIRRYVDPGVYIIPPEDRELVMWRDRVKFYLESAEFKEAQERRKQGPERGIIINAGGRKLLSSAVILLKVLREELNCTLPVELVWHGPQEMDNATLAGLKKFFDPLEGYDVTTKPYPKHQRKAASLARFEGKVFSLLYSKFQKVLMLDCDLVPLMDPDMLFNSPDFLATGNLFWPDIWQNWVSPDIYDIIGLTPDVMPILEQGRGITRRDTESGEVLLDLVEHADVIEYLCFINSYSDRIYKTMWGDKDTFPLAFGLAGKAHLYSQVQVPPGGVFKWRHNMLLTKDTEQRSDGWQLMGMTQFDHLARPAFLHRTINKFWLESDAWPVELVTGPLPYRWAHYYIAHDSLGPTKGVPWDYVAPSWAFYVMQLNPITLRAYPDQGKWRHIDDGSYDGCPAAHYFDYRRMRELGLPLDAVPELEAACGDLLKRTLGPERYAEYQRRGLLEQPQLLGLHARYTDDIIVIELQDYPKDHPELKWHEVGEPLPIAGWRTDYEHPQYDGPVQRCMRASYSAFEWLNRKETLQWLPRIRDGP